MVSSHFAAILTAFLYLGRVLCVPVDGNTTVLDTAGQNVVKRGVPAAPHFAIYWDDWINDEWALPDTSYVEGYNVFILAFLMTTGATDQAGQWVQIGSEARGQSKTLYNDAGIQLMVSAFGSTDAPTTNGYDAVDTANTMAAWVIEYELDGIDIDYEDFQAFDYGTGQAETWLITFTQQLRTQLPVGQYILTHAPVAPWFSPNMWSGGGYLYIDQQLGDDVDWYNLQFYNQNNDDYISCDGLLHTSNSDYPQSALFEIAQNGVSLDKLVIGKPASPDPVAYPTTGYMSADLLATCVAEAYDLGWNTGVMVWEFPIVATGWITTVRGNTWPVS